MRWCCRLNARRYVCNRLLNNFLRRLLTSSVHFSSPQKAMWLFRDPLGTAPPEQKTKSAKTAQLCGFSAFTVRNFCAMQHAFYLRKTINYFSDLFYARSNRLFRQSRGLHLQPLFCIQIISAAFGSWKESAPGGTIKMRCKSAIIYPRRRRNGCG